MKTQLVAHPKRKRRKRMMMMMMVSYGMDFKCTVLYNYGENTILFIFGIPPLDWILLNP